jgi:hypothetical protein
MNTSNLIAVIIGIIFYLGLLFFFIDKRSPFHEWAETNPWFSFSIFFILAVMGFYVIL